MANTYTKIFLHIVFTVNRRQKLIPRECNESLQKYITGIVKNRGHKLLAINNEPDHMHILISFTPTTNLAKLVQEIKAVSSKFINENRWIKQKFSWQKGYGAFSCCHWHIDKMKRYIQNQEEHHRRSTFEKEYLAFLKKYGVEYNDIYVFD